MRPANLHSASVVAYTTRRNKEFKNFGQIKPVEGASLSPRAMRCTEELNCFSSPTKASGAFFTPRLLVAKKPPPHPSLPSPHPFSPLLSRLPSLSPSPRGVVIEEMLHMVNAANVLNAIGGAPFIDHPDFVPKYPLVLPLINVTASITWFSEESILHYQMLESVPKGGWNSTISAAYQHIINALTSLCGQHGEAAIFTGNSSLQVQATSNEGQMASKVFSLQNATTALLGVADQGGGCPVTGQPWPQVVNISAGPLGGIYSHAARYTEILKGRKYLPTDTVDEPSGPALNISWGHARRFTPNPSVNDFLPEQCVGGGSWIVRNETFFVSELWLNHGKHLSNSITESWHECARLCRAWTIDNNEGLIPCAMWR